MKNFLLRIINNHRLPAIILTVCVFFCVPIYIGEHASKEIVLPTERIKKMVFQPVGDKLCDVNDTHLQFATTCGITPIKRNKDFADQRDSLCNNGKLVYIAPCRFYDLDRLTHSHPYLTPAAKRLLEDIGERFRQKQIEKGLKVHKMVLTSLLRTEQNQKSLRKSNFNATNSTTSHMYGTTFDISAKRFVNVDFMGNVSGTTRPEYLRLLEEAVKELRSEGRCAVMREYKQACIHITVTE